MASRSSRFFMALTVDVGGQHRSVIYVRCALTIARDLARRHPPIRIRSNDLIKKCPGDTSEKEHRYHAYTCVPSGIVPSEGPGH